jgi:murein DD-endopeptidase MepM/ murein hydrolase activator NlpD
MTRAALRVLLTTILIIGAMAAGAASALGAQGTARAVPVPFRPPPPTTLLVLPVPGPAVVTRPFAPPSRPWLPGHRGVDLAAPPGTAVRAAAAGVVIYAGVLAGRPVVSVAHAGGLRTTYEPVRPLVAAGQRVAAGEVIGVLELGHPGCPAPACLHWGARLGETYVDPLSLLGIVQVRLKPLLWRSPSLARGLGPLWPEADHARGWAWL